MLTLSPTPPPLPPFSHPHLGVIVRLSLAFRTDSPMDIISTRTSSRMSSAARAAIMPNRAVARAGVLVTGHTSPNALKLSNAVKHMYTTRCPPTVRSWRRAQLVGLLYEVYHFAPLCTFPKSEALQHARELHVHCTMHHNIPTPSKSTR